MIKAWILQNYSIVKTSIFFKSGADKMSSTIPYKKNGLPQILLKFHDTLIQDFVKYYESDKHIRKEVKKAHKALKQALKIARKKKINPGIKIGEARDIFESLRQEMDFTTQALTVTTNNLQDALIKIQVERIEEPLAVINEARDFFREKQIDKGIGVLKESEARIRKKVLVKSRSALFGGISNEVTQLRDQFEEYKNHKKNRKKDKKKNHQDAYRDDHHAIYQGDLEIELEPSGGY